VPAFLFAGTGAFAQSVDLVDLEICAALGTDELKLACFETIVDSGKAARDQGHEAVVAPVEVERDVPAVPATAPPVVQAGNSASQASVATSEPAAVAAAGVGRAMPQATTGDDGFGREHLESGKESEPETMSARVINVEQTSRRILSFHLDNGQVWRQTESRFFPYPREGEFDVTISAGMMGDYRLRVGGEGRMLRVRRVQ
jgi:hypothetical protein